MPQSVTQTGQDACLNDAFSRTIDYLRLSITDRCNLKCIYCMPSEGIKGSAQSELLSGGEIVRVVRTAHRLGVRKVRITGGEPLVRRDIIPIIAAIKKSADIRDLSLTTNGMLLAGMAAELKAAGLDRVNISLDTLDAGRYRKITRGGDIDLVEDAIRAAEKAGLSPVKINMVVMRGINEDEVRTFAELTRNRDIHVRFIEHMPAGRNGWSRRNCVPSREIIDRIAEAGQLFPLPYRGKGPSRNYRLSGCRGVIGFISPVSDHFCRYCNRLRLTAAGFLKPCLFASGGVDIKGPLRRGADDRELERLFKQAAAAKPGGHSLHLRDRANSGMQAMAQIGG